MHGTLNLRIMGRTQISSWTSTLYKLAEFFSDRQFVASIIDQIKGGKFTARLVPDTILTLTTSTGQAKGSYSGPPSKPFPIPYKDDFESERSIRVYLSYNNSLAYDEYSEAKYFADQTGVWEIRQDSKGVKGKVMEQVKVLQPLWEVRS